MSDEASTGDKYAEAVKALDQSYPNGWRCGHDLTDGMTVVLATGLRQMLTALLSPTLGGDTRDRR